MFANYTPLTIDHTQVSGNQVKFPILINKTDNRFKHVSFGGHVQSLLGYDLRPYLDTRWQLPMFYELERYNPATGQVVMWTMKPTITSSVDETFFLNYNDPYLVNDGTNNTGCWSDGIALTVNHFKDGTTYSSAASLGNFLFGLTNGATATEAVIDGGVNLVAASTQSLQEGTGGMWTSPAIYASIWAYISAFNGTVQTAIGQGFSGSDMTAIYVRNDGKLSMNIVASTNLGYNGTGVNVVSAGAWYHLALNYDVVNGMNGYVNGVFDKNVPTNGNVHTNSLIATWLGVSRGGVNSPWNGILDELHSGNAPRSAGWYLTSITAKNQPQPFFQWVQKVPVAVFPPAPSIVYPQYSGITGA